MTTEILKLDNEIIECPIIDGMQYVAIKPICTLLGIDWKNQYDVLNSQKIFTSTMVQCTTVAADKKGREMVCLPLKYVLLWLGKINPNKVKPEAKEAIENYQLKIADILFEKFYEEPHFEHQKAAEIREIEAHIEVVKLKSKEEVKELSKKLFEKHTFTFADYKRQTENPELPFQEPEIVEN